MARTPLFPAFGNVAAWAHQFSMRTERDYARLYPKSGTVSLSATTTNTVIDINVTPQSRIVLQPITSQAAALMATIWVAGKSDGSFTIAGTVSASCVFDYLVLPPPPP